MPTSYTSLLGLALPVTGELSGTWGDEVNNYITQYLDASVAGTQTISGSQTAVTLSKTTNASLSQAGSGATGSSQYLIINCTGNPASMLTITAPAASKPYIVINGTSTNQDVKIVGAGPTTGVTLAAGEKAVIAWNGSDFVKVASSVADGVTSVSGTGTVNGITLTGTVTSTGNLTLGGTLSNVSLSSQVTGTLPVANGGTGQTTYTDGQLLIGNSTGNTLAKSTLTAGSGISITNGAGSITIAATSTADVTLAGNNAFTGANTFYNATGQTFGTATSTQDGIILAGRAGGSSSYRVTLQPGTLSASRTLTLPDASTTVVGTDATQTLTNKTLTNPTVTNYVETPYTANTGTAITVDLANGTVQILTLTGNATITMPTATSGKSFIIMLKQDGTGGRSVTWSTVKWPGGTAPTITTTASRQDIYSFFADGTNWYGTTIGQNYTP